MTNDEDAATMRLLILAPFRLGDDRHGITHLGHAEEGLRVAAGHANTSVRSWIARASALVKSKVTAAQALEVRHGRTVER